MSPQRNNFERLRKTPQPSAPFTLMRAKARLLRELKTDVL
jgi:hypothetical protein